MPDSIENAARVADAYCFVKIAKRTKHARDGFRVGPASRCLVRTLRPVHGKVSSARGIPGTRSCAFSSRAAVARSPGGEFSGPIEWNSTRSLTTHAHDVASRSEATLLHWHANGHHMDRETEDVWPLQTFPESTRRFERW